MKHENLKRPSFKFHVFKFQFWMANTENIEAKLAAYVDDELDAADRLEIEQHLASNPEHRVMIEQLRQQKQYLRALPRVSAPPEVAEVMAAQLERAALLGDVEIGSAADAGATPFSRWPQVRAIAAVILLTVGLAAVLYKVLPSPTPSTPHVALVIPEPTRESEVDRSVADRDTSHDDTERTRIATGPAEVRAPNPPAGLNGTVRASLGADGERAAGRTQGNELYLYVDTSDTTAANRQVVDFLAMKRIEYRQAAANELGRGVKDLRRARATAIDADSTTAPTPTTYPGIPETAIASPATSNSLDLPPGAQIVGGVADATTQPREVSPNAIVAKMTRDEAVQLSEELSQSQAQQKQVAQIVWPPEQQVLQSSPAGGQMISQDQLPTTRSTSDAVSAGIEDKKAGESENTRGGTGGATTEPSVLAGGDTVRVRAREGGFAKSESFDDTVAIDADGYINVPGAGKVTAAGLTPEQLAKELNSQTAVRMKEANAPATEMYWSVERLATKTPLQLPMPPAPTTAMSGVAGPTTAPVSDTANPREDVVIVLRQISAPAAPATAPSTAPSSSATEVAPQPHFRPTSQPTTMPSR